MGCVIGKTASGQRRSIAGSPNCGRSSDQPSVTVTEAVNAVRDKKEVKQRQKTRHSGDFQADVPTAERRRPRPEPFLRNQQGWPSWLMAVAGDAIGDWTPRRANTFEKLDKIGQGTYSNVYKARDLITGKIVALKKVRFDNLEPESVKFMAREILVLRRLDHPNVLKLEGLVTSRMSCSLYLVFEYMDHDLAGLAARHEVKFTEAQVKCYMKQLLCGLEHCHSRGVLHRDIKGSNLLIDNEGVLKIADFGLATFFDPQRRVPMTSRVVTLWYRPPELLLGATYYGVGVDLWSAGCILAELLAGKPIMPGRTEFFTTEPYACEPSSLPKYPPSKEMDVKLREEEARRQRGLSGKANVVDGARRVRIRDRVGRAIPAPEANAENPSNLDRLRVMTQANAKSKSEKFPPPHQDAAVGHRIDASHKAPVSFGAPDSSFNSSIFTSKSSASIKSAGASGGPSRRKKTNKEDPQMAPSRKFMRPFNPSTVGLSMDLLFKGKSEVFGRRR
ncbi:probable serine/threonine-protein kinase At1g54610 isoform X2 [Hevea brasiliensis]|uniref:probable serine/threonine-protein kinase At1g54610 isoform X2 n=1 Tax=Hevea brasiliensis TaxID=3981 RepID=UPI000B78B29C|nr:probable serine/threonine-protein kinase At1g54610 isoform X2 [Hevea brasiliensis]